jgi:hypothetical protein
MTRMKPVDAVRSCKALLAELFLLEPTRASAGLNSSGRGVKLVTWQEWCASEQGYGGSDSGLGFDRCWVE